MLLTVCRLRRNGIWRSGRCTPTISPGLQTSPNCRLPSLVLEMCFSLKDLLRSLLVSRRRPDYTDHQPRHQLNLVETVSTFFLPECKA